MSDFLGANYLLLHRRAQPSIRLRMHLLHFLHMVLVQNVWEKRSAIASRALVGLVASGHLGLLALQIMRRLLLLLKLIRII